MTTTASVSLRPATASDALDIAHLFQMSSDGVADYVWQGLAETREYAGLELVEVGARRYARENTEFSFQNCTLAKRGDATVGMLHAWGMWSDPDATAANRAADELGEDIDPVLAPYAVLELVPSLYVSGVAVKPAARGQGIGTRLLTAARRQARDLGLPAVSLIVFEQNTGAAALYARLGYREIMRRPIVPHPLIHFTGDAVLLALDI